MIIPDIRHCCRNLLCISPQITRDQLNGQRQLDVYAFYRSFLKLLKYEPIPAASGAVEAASGSVASGLDADGDAIMDEVDTRPDAPLPVKESMRRGSAAKTASSKGDPPPSAPLRRAVSAPGMGQRVYLHER